ncbi:hypothetical protein FZEAL_2144 [Fusarium zealandicum]|uniref:GPI inositol-deacylase n=1 Tax=Fusarium zealandicum TaxID=1053134 RepID=A0A8H4XP68_9HYPO|nr:hypothetical protein FZEAL_2144 [Fusarium zealandicum]
MFFRKQRRANSDLPQAGSSSTRSAVASLLSPFSLSRTSSSKTPSNAPNNVESPIPPGPLGLTLLYSPPEPQIDFIFVHGLGGNSRKTWTKESMQSLFWPQEWLPKDPAFKNVRIHSYGYDSEYLKGREDRLNIHHVGKSLLGAISTSPCIANCATRIVTVGHSIGGLVAKKAFILAKQDAVLETLAGRFRAFYFLATPHRGSDSAKLLKNLVKIAYERAYVPNLGRNSASIQVINDEFRHFSADLELWSFYETKHMRHFSSPIVDPESAVLGYPGEKQMPMDADHRSICKFDTSDDANYRLLRNALAWTVNNISAVAPELKLKKRSRIKELKQYLEVSEIMYDDLLTVRQNRLHDSCQWLTAKPSYVEWRDGKSGNDRTLWIKGKPATGKSVLAGYVVDDLRESGLECSYFFFKHGDESKSSIGRCLRSLAFQIASSNIEVGDAILEMQADGIRLDHVDEPTLWRVLFQSCIFPSSTTRHYWVIDALDECFDPPVFFDVMISSIGELVPLRIMVTSLDTASLDLGFSSIPSNLSLSLLISTTDTEQDLRRLVKSKTHALGAVGPEDSSLFVERIVEKAKGSFLWTILVLKELAQCHSKKEINEILEEVPKGMESLYKRILDSMSQATRGKRLAKAILMWAACAIRPMTIEELNGALRLDIDDSFPRLEKSIAALCGQLVVVDKFDRVQMVHETARRFLLSSGFESEFSLDKVKAHTRMAQISLTYFVGEEMQPPRTNPRRSSAGITTRRLDFAAYACTAYSYHLSKADPLSLETFLLVEKFLKSNVLAWIETIADSRNLNQLIRASKHLETYGIACAVSRPPLDPRIKHIQKWIIDLARIPAMFGNALVASPSAIYSLIPPFCPTDSMIFNTNGRGRRLSVVGASTKQWDDRLLCIDFQQAEPSSLCYGDEFVAVGLTSGLISLYHVTSYQEYNVLDHGESISLVAFKSKSDFMATCGMGMLKIWNIRSGKVVHSFDSPPGPLDMGFDGEVLLIASSENYIASWDFTTGTDPILAQRPWNDGPEKRFTPTSECPCVLALFASQGIFAVAWINQPITLWDIEEGAYAGSCGMKNSRRETSSYRVVALAFNPNPNVGLLAVAYVGGDLALLDPFADKQLECIQADCQTLAASPDGRLLAAGGGGGIIHVYEFDTFRLLYRVKSSGSYIKQLAFARNSVRLADIRGSQCTVWEPGALLRDSRSDESRGVTSTSMVEMVSVESKAKITAMVVHPTAEIVFCGMDDGSVVLYSRKTAARLRTLCSHKAPIRLLAWCESKSALMSADASNKILLHAIHKSESQGWLADAAMLFTSRLESNQAAIVDVLVGDAASKFVVSTRESDHMFTLDDGEQRLQQTCSSKPGIRKWILHPQSPLHLVCLDNVEARVYCWADWSQVKSVPLSLNHETMQLKNATLYSMDRDQRILLELSDRDGSVSPSSIVVSDVAYLSLEDEGNRFLPQKLSESADIADQIETAGDKEKTIMTSCSLPMLDTQTASLTSNITHVIGGKLAPGLGGGSSVSEVLRHFFIPHDWFAGERDVVCALAQNDILLTRGSDLAVIRRGFEQAERIVY